MELNRNRRTDNHHGSPGMSHSADTVYHAHPAQVLDCLPQGRLPHRVRVQGLALALHDPRHSQHNPDYLHSNSMFPLVCSEQSLRNVCKNLGHSQDSHSAQQHSGDQ
jgi:hypothetical protein